VVVTKFLKRIHTRDSRYGVGVRVTFPFGFQFVSNEIVRRKEPTAIACCLLEPVGEVGKDKILGLAIQNKNSFACKLLILR